ncbi:MAG: PVC-type heme-binding CxxCH protein [Planctomycetota bacterium]
MKETPFFTSFAILIWGSIGWFALPGCRASDFPELYNSEPKSEESRTPPKQAARETQIDEGFRLSVFARDPDVQNPIDSAWDDRGRLWIAENYTYAERTQKFDRSLRDRVVVLEGTGGDTATKRTVFTDQVQMLTSVEVGLGGVWLMCPPQVLFIPDEDGDLVPDGPAEVVLDGFKVAEANYHNFANGLRFGPDGWLYGRCGGSCPGRVGKPGTPEEERVAVEGAIWRYNVQTEIFEVLTSGTTNPWGHDFNRLGEGFFINTVNGHFWHLIHGAHFTRPFTLDPNSDTYALIDMHADHYHFDTGSAWHQQRAGVANSFGGGHAHVGGMIYQGTAWPDSYRGDFYTLNFHGRRVNREHLHDHGSGFVAHHGEDTFITPDVWFRGMELSSGPDGNVFVLDWSDAGECHEHDGVHRTSGAIFKWSYDQSPNSADRSIVPDFRGLESGELVALNLDDDVWYRRQARLELQRRKNDQKLDQTAINLVKSHLSDRHPTWIRAQSLMTLSAIGQPIDSELLVDADAKIRKLAVRLLGQHWPIDDAMGDSWKQSFSVSIPSGVRTQILRAASVEDEPSVLLDYASMLQRLPYDFRVDLAEALVGKAIAIGDHNLPKMIWYGLIPVARNNPAALASVLRQSVIPETSRYVARAMASKTRSHPDALAACVEAMPGLTSELQHATLTGLMDAFTGWRKVDPPAEWSSVQKRLADEEQIQELSEQLSALFGDGQAI